MSDQTQEPSRQHVTDDDIYYKHISRQIDREDGLINTRLTWLLQFEGFLFAAFAVLDSKTDYGVLEQWVQVTIALSGLVAALWAYFAVKAALDQIGYLKEQWENRKVPEHVLPRPYGDEKAHGAFKLFAGHLPTIVGVAWLLVVSFMAASSSWGLRRSATTPAPHEKEAPCIRCCAGTETAALPCPEPPPCPPASVTVESNGRLSLTKLLLLKLAEAGIALTEDTVDKATDVTEEFTRSFVSSFGSKVAEKLVDMTDRGPSQEDIWLISDEAKKRRSTPTPTATPSPCPSPVPCNDHDDVSSVLWRHVVYFDFGDANLSREYVQQLRDYATRDVPGECAVEVRGFADRVGSSDYNLSLSWRRANAVTETLVAAGVDPWRIHVVPRGAEEARHHAHSGNGDPNDRRAEARITCRQRKDRTTPTD